MSLDPRVRRFLDVLAAGNPRDARSVSVAERRAQLIELLHFTGPLAPIAGALVAGVTYRIIAGEPPAPAVVGEPI